MHSNVLLKYKCIRSLALDLGGKIRCIAFGVNALETQK